DLEFAEGDRRPAEHAGVERRAFGHPSLLDGIAFAIDAARTRIDDEVQSRVRQLSLTDRNVGVADFVGRLETADEFVPGALLVLEMNLPFHLRRASGLAVLCDAKRQCAEIISLPGVGVDAKARGLAFDAAVGVLETPIGSGHVVRIARRLGADEIFSQAVADASDPNAGMNLAPMYLGKAKRIRACRPGRRHVSHVSPSSQRACRGRRSPAYDPAQPKAYGLSTALLCELAHTDTAANGSIICKAFQRRVSGDLYRPGIPQRVCVHSSAKLGLAKWRSKCSTQYAARLRIPYTVQLTRLNNMACIGSS